MKVDVGNWGPINGLLKQLSLIKSHAVLVFDEEASRGVDMAGAIAGFVFNLIRFEHANGYEQAIGRGVRSANIKSEGENHLLATQSDFHNMQDEAITNAEGVYNERIILLREEEGNTIEEQGKRMALASIYHRRQMKLELED